MLCLHGPLRSRWLDYPSAIVAGLVCLCAGAFAGSAPVIVRVDLSRTNGLVRSLHGINKGPLANGGLLDLSAPLRELGAPFTRLHDCQWPYPEVVDIHAIFRQPSADPAEAANYDFSLTDNYLAAIQKTGAQIVYRLGESIEHAPVKRFVHPPTDPARWAAVCLGIVRHYNEGWAGGSRYGIRYWEIWNEPENRPAMWSGTDEDYFRLYRTTAKTLKQAYPDLKIGGPAVGYSGRMEGETFTPSEFVTNFLAMCRRENLPLDFFSWHCYTANPSELSQRARAIRRLLDDHGFARTESHLNEWNYLPGNTWDGMSSSARPEARQAWFDEMAGAAGAAFVVTALIELQAAPVDICNFYHGELGPFGLFNEYGAPNQVFHGLRAFQRVAALKVKVESEGGIPGCLAVLAARSPDGSHAALLVANFRSDTTQIEAELKGLPEGLSCARWSLDALQTGREAERKQISGGRCTLRFPLAAPGILLLEFQ